MLSTDPSYDNRTITSTLKMQIWIATNNRDVPHIFKVGLKVSTKVYLDVLKSVVIPWCNQVAGGRPWVSQQNSAPTHKSKETQAWLQKECNDFVPFSLYNLLRISTSNDDRFNKNVALRYNRQEADNIQQKLYQMQTLQMIKPNPNCRA